MGTAFRERKKRGRGERHRGNKKERGDERGMQGLQGCGFVDETECVCVRVRAFLRVQTHDRRKTQVCAHPIHTCVHTQDTCVSVSEREREREEEALFCCSRVCVCLCLFVSLPGRDR